MKKIILLIFLLIFSTKSFAGIYGRVEIGTPVQNSRYFKSNKHTEYYDNTYFTNLVFGYKNYILGVEYKIFGGIFTWSNRDGIKLSGKPFEDIYGIGGILNYKGAYLQYNHFCAHPVITNYTKYNNYIPDKQSWISTITSITIGYEFNL